MRVFISAEIEVTDPVVLRRYARERYTACWGSDDGFPADLPNQVLEAMLLSNENPSPDEIGVAFVSHSAREAG